MSRSFYAITMTRSSHSLRRLAFFDESTFEPLYPNPVSRQRQRRLENEIYLNAFFRYYSRVPGDKHRTIEHAAGQRENFI